MGAVVFRVPHAVRLELCEAWGRSTHLSTTPKMPKGLTVTVVSRVEAGGRRKKKSEVTHVSLPRDQFRGALGTF